VEKDLSGLRRDSLELSVFREPDRITSSARATTIEDSTFNRWHRNPTHTTLNIDNTLAISAVRYAMTRTNNRDYPAIERGPEDMVSLISGGRTAQAACCGVVTRHVSDATEKACTRLYRRQTVTLIGV
jgi:hypothetical protein